MKMQSPSLKNKQFLEDYNSVLSHHVDCILKSHILLDEDMHLVLTFWDPNVFVKNSKWLPNVLTSSVYVTVGLLASLRLKNVYPLTIAAAPGTIQICQHMRKCYFKRKYKQNCEKLLKLIFELYELNRSILEYYHKRDSATQAYKMPNEAYTILLKPGEEFLKSTTLFLIEILDKVRENMLEISNLVPLTEGDYIYSLEWNLEQFKKLDYKDFKELQHQFQKLCDVYVLIVSNFLSCMGLSFCVQLWKETSCNFKTIFDKLIPGLICSLEKTLNNIKKNFNHIRFTLYNAEDEILRKQREKSKPNNKNFVRLQQPLQDFLTNMQVTFETATQLQLLTSRCDINKDYENLYPFVENVKSQFEVCDDSLNTLFKVFCLLTKKSVSKKADSIPLTVANNDGKISAEIRYDDPLEMLEDEEYNLSIHGSDDEDSGGPRLYEDVDNYSTEHLELMLFELKRKLKERKGGHDKNQDEQKKITVFNGIDNNVDSGLKIEQLPTTSKSIVERLVPPVPPPLPLLNQDSLSAITVEQLPVVDNIHIGLLDAVKNVAQKLNRDEEFQFGFNMFPDLPRPFNTTYRCFSVAMLPGNERQDVERGGKIIMPPSALEQLTRLNINYPMLFKIVNKKTSRITHCGVLEFVADEGKVYLPLWMMHNLVLEEGDLIQIESVSLPVGSFAKFQPLSPEFLDITNPKAVLENCLRTFACLTSGDVIAVKYNQRVYELCVLETQPGNAISIIECDMNVEFAAPVGYKEHEDVRHKEEDMVVDPADLMPEPAGFVAFRGTGNRLDGKRRKDSNSSESSPPKPVYVKGIPDYDYQIGTLRFLRHITKSPVNDDKEESEEFKAFSGEGFSLKRRN